ncbi:MAG: rhodanese-like domain-containing protein [Lachnospiraceae bacterium]
MKKTVLFLMLAVLTIGCGGVKQETITYNRINMEELAEELEKETDFLLLDVRTEEEFIQGHIPGAVCLPVADIEAGETSILSDKTQRIYVYCRSGNRSIVAAESLMEQGYTNVVECGGISDWTGELVFGNE